MRNRKLSPSGDYTWGNSQLDFYNNVPAAVGQAVKTRLLLFQGEWFLDTDEGLPLLEGIIGKHPKSMADATILDRTTGTEGLASVTQFSSEIDPSTRAYSVTMSIDTIYGPVQVTVLLKIDPTGFSTLDTESGFYLETETGDPIVI